MEAWRPWGVTPKNPSDNAKHKYRKHETLTPSTSAVDLSHQGYVDFAGKTQSQTTLHLAENSNDFPHHHKESGRQGPILLLLVFFSTLIILQWRLWPSYNAQLRESFHGTSGLFLGARSNNETDDILSQLRANGTTPCHKAQTNFTLLFDHRFEDYDPSVTPLSLSTDTLHTILMDSYSADGARRCSGGDYYETILYNNHWRSRPQVQDLGNGSYRISLFVDSLFKGLFNFSASLLFGNFHGLDHMTGSWVVEAQVVFFQVEFFSVNVDSKSRNEHQGPNSQLTMMVGEIPQQFKTCTVDNNNFQQKEWTGRWTREWVNNSCLPNKQGRFLECVSKEHEFCHNFGLAGQDSCSGRLSRLESNGWVYSQAHCGFHIYEVQEAWDCLSDRWLLFWGDSNFQDTIRNLMLFVLNIPIPYWGTLSTFQLPRNLEEYFVNPERPDQALHVSLIFNGHFSVGDGNLGLDSLQDSTYREYISRHFRGNSSSPDIVIMNSGLHDGLHFNSVASYVAGADRAVDFWKGLLDTLPASKRPQVVYSGLKLEQELWITIQVHMQSFMLRIHDIVQNTFSLCSVKILNSGNNINLQVAREDNRTTVAPAGQSRGMQSNPHKMEVFNKVMVERLLSSIPSARIVDAFDMTFPFHFNNDYSDGGHYGRAPKADLKPWFGQPHQYFVDLMVVHVLLNSICPIPTSV